MKERSRGKEEKLDCRGVPLAELARQEEEKKKKVEDMTQEIVNTIDVYYSSNGKFDECPSQELSHLVDIFKTGSVCDDSTSFPVVASYNMGLFITGWS